MAKVRSKLKVRVLAVTIALLIGLGISELGCRWILDANGMHYGIEMWKYARLIKRREDNPQIGHAHRPDTAAVLMGVPVKINSQGLRDREFLLAKPEGAYRILVLGDSMTFGWGAAVDKCYPKVVEQMLAEKPPASEKRAIEVINTGVGNYNTVQEVAYFEKHGLQFQPDRVVLGFFINDAEPVPQPKGGFLAQHSYLYVLSSSARRALSRKAGRLPGWRIDYYLQLYDEEQAGWQNCRQAIEQLIDTCRQHDIELTVMLIPELHDLRNYPFQEVYDRVAAVANDRQVPVVDARQAFPDDVDPRSLWVSPGDAHPNAKGHHYLAQALYDHLAQELAEPKNRVPNSKQP